MFPGLKKYGVILLLPLFILLPVFSGYGAENGDLIPYCISVTFNGDVQSGRGFTWYTDAQCASDLLLAEKSLGKGNDFSDAKLYQGMSTQVERYTGRKALKKRVSMHRLTLADLKADTAYVYKVGDAGRGIWSEPGNFHTAAREDVFHLIMVADSQGEDEPDFLLSAQTLRMARKTVPDAHFLIHLGDFVQSYSSEGSFENFAEWQHFFATAQTELMQTTILPVAGNHDQTSNVFANQFALDKLTPVGANTETGVYYAVNYANACFIVLNTNEGYQNGTGKISEPQIEWLKRTAALADQQGVKWKILLLHRGIYSFGRHMDSEDILALRAQLAPLISDLGIDLVFQGHDHVYMRSQVLAKSASGPVVPQADRVKLSRENFEGEKTDFVVNPSGTTYIIPNVSGTQFGFRKESSTVQVYPEATYKPDDNDEPIFARISIDGKRLVYTAYAYDREGDGAVKEIDRYAILKDEEVGVRPPALFNGPPEGIAPAVMGIRELWQFVQGFYFCPTGLYLVSH